jgi:hypothetical protein
MARHVLARGASDLSVARAMGIDPQSLITFSSGRDDLRQMACRIGS